MSNDPPVCVTTGLKRCKVVPRAKIRRRQPSLPRWPCSPHSERRETHLHCDRYCLHNKGPSVSSPGLTTVVRRSVNAAVSQTNG